MCERRRSALINFSSALPLECIGSPSSIGCLPPHVYGHSTSDMRRHVHILNLLAFTAAMRTPIEPVTRRTALACVTAAIPAAVVA